MSGSSGPTAPVLSWQKILLQALPSLVFLILVIFLTIASGYVNSGSRWLIHSLTAIAGIFLLVVVITMGAVQSGRLPFLHLRPRPFLHKTAATVFAGIVVGTFFLGLQVAASHGEQLLTTPHGVLGLIVAALCTVQLVPSILVQQRLPIQKFHRVVGYLIVPLFLLQILAGLAIVHFFGLHL